MFGTSFSRFGAGFGRSGAAPFVPIIPTGIGANMADDIYWNNNRNHMNLAWYDRWLSRASGNPPLIHPMVDGGELMTMPPEGVEKIIGYPRASGRVRFQWTGPVGCALSDIPTATFTAQWDASPAPTFGTMTIGGVPYRWAEANITVPASRYTGGSMPRIKFSYSALTNPIRNLDAREVGATTDMFDPVAVAEKSKYKVLRYMDWGLTNYIWHGDDVTEEIDGANTAPVYPTGAMNITVDSMPAIIVSNGPDSITLKAMWYVNDAAFLAQYLPNHWFGPYCSKISVAINAPSGAGDVVLSTSGGKFDLTITPPSGSTTSSLQSWINAHAIASNFIRATAITGGSATWTATLSKTYYPTGQVTPFNYRYGIPVANVAEFSNKTGTRPWYNLPAPISVAEAVRRVGQLISALEQKNLPVIVELGNEPWNALFLRSGFNNAWAIKLGLANGLTYHYTRHVLVMNALKAAYGNKVLSVLNMQNTGGANITAAQGVSGLADATDAYAIAPYFGGSNPADLATAKAGLWSDIETNLNTLIPQARAVCDALGKKLFFYEVGQHMTKTSTQALQISIQYDAEMGDMYRYYYSEIQRRWPDTLFANFTDVQPILNAGSWYAFGLQQYTGETTAPKFIAVNDIIDGQVAPYFVPRGTYPSVSTSNPIVGQAIGLTAFTPANYTAISYQWLRDGVDIAGETAATYMPVAADDGKVNNCRVTLVNATNGKSVQYTTTNATATVAYTELAETTAYVSRLTAAGDAPTFSRKVAINNFINALKNGSTNIWAKCALLALPAKCGSKASAVLNLKGGTTYDIQDVGTGLVFSGGALAGSGSTTNYGRIGSGLGVIAIASSVGGGQNNLTTMVSVPVASTGNGTLLSNAVSGATQIISVPNTGNALLRASQDSGLQYTPAVRSGTFSASRSLASGAGAAEFQQNTTVVGTSIEASSATDTPARLGYGGVVGFDILIIASYLTKAERDVIHNALVTFRAAP